MTKPDLEMLFKESLEFRICRDLANGMKHLSLDQKPSTKAFSVGRQYQAPLFVVFVVNVAGKSKPEELRERLYDVLDLADRCVNRWREFLKAKELL